MIGGDEILKSQPQTTFAHPNDTAAQALVPVRITMLETISEGSADVDVAALQDKSVDALELFSGEANGSGPHGDSQGGARLARPILADEINNRHDIAALMEAKAGAFAA